MTDEATLRPATADDVRAITGCAVNAYRKYVPRIGEKPAPMVANFAAHVAAGEFHVLSFGERLAGYIVIIARHECPFVDNVAVDPRWQGRGLGHRLVEFAESVARKRHLPEVRLYTNVVMTENLEFYRRLGFAETERRREDGFDRVYMTKPLAGANRETGVPC